MSSKNSTTQKLVQEAPLTEAMPFFGISTGNPDSGLIGVCTGQPISEALNLSSMLLHSATELMTRLTEGGMNTNEIYAIRFLVDSSAALIDASVHSVEFGNRQGGAQ